MKILNSERLSTKLYEMYDLTNIRNQNIPVGILICYLFVNSDEVKFLHFVGTSESEEIGTGFNIVSVEQEEKDKYFCNLKALNLVFQIKDLYEWKLNIEYNNCALTVVGEVNSSTIGVFLPLSATKEHINLIREVEQNSWNYHLYDDTIIEKIKNYFKLNQRITVECMDELEKHPDIQKEFLNGLQDSAFVFIKDNPISVQGYTAKYLFENYPLNELGAYNYLIYLREKPEEALEKLKQGLPRK